MVPDTLAILPPAMFPLVRFSESAFFMYAPSGAAAKVLTNPAKKLNHDVWKARMCGFANEKILMAVALCSASICARRAGNTC